MTKQPLGLSAFGTTALPRDSLRSCSRAERAVLFRGKTRGSLTPHEREVLKLVAPGLPNKVVGGELGISEITVKVHRGNVMRKMNAGSFDHLVKMASKLRVVRAPSPQKSTDQYQLHDETENYIAHDIDPFWKTI